MAESYHRPAECGSLLKPWVLAPFKAFEPAKPSAISGLPLCIRRAIIYWTGACLHPRIPKAETHRPQ